MRNFDKYSALFLSVALMGTALSPVFGAENLRMREGVSFSHDLDQGFPILADRLDDVQIASGKVTLLFFGAAGDLNTNRQAKRIVDLYRKYKNEPIKFIVVDVDNANSAQLKPLLRAYYAGYIPSMVVFDKQGKQKWNHTGEVDATAVVGQIDKLL